MLPRAALLAALSTIDDETASSLSEFTETGLADTIGGRIWSEIMATTTFPFVSRTRREAEAKGKAEARMADIFKVLSSQGIKIDDKSRQRISACTDADLLEIWFDRSLIAAEASDLFKE